MSWRDRDQRSEETRVKQEWKAKERANGLGSELVLEAFWRRLGPSILRKRQEQAQRAAS